MESDEFAKDLTRRLANRVALNNSPLINVDKLPSKSPIKTPRPSEVHPVKLRTVKVPFEIQRMKSKLGLPEIRVPVSTPPPEVKHGRPIRKSTVTYEEKMKKAGFVKVSALPPIPNIDQFKEELYTDNFLLQHRLTTQLKNARMTLYTERGVRVRERVQNAIKDYEEIPDPYPESSRMEFKKTMQFLKEQFYKAPVPELEDRVYESICRRIPLNDKIRRSISIAVLNELESSVRNDAEESYRQANLKLSLNPVELVEPPYEYGWPVITEEPPWHESFFKTRDYLKKNLFGLHPALARVLGVCGELMHLIVDCSSFRKIGAVDVTTFAEEIRRNITNSENYIMKTWFPKIADIFRGDQVQLPINPKKKIRFFQALHKLMCIQMKSLLDRSLSAYSYLFIDTHEELLFPEIKIQMSLENYEIDFYPSYDEIENLYMSVIDLISRTGQNILTVTAFLNNTKELLSTSLSNEIIQYHSKIVLSTVRKHFAPLRTLQHELTTLYNYLVNGQAERKLKTFCAQEHTFDEYREYVEKFDETIKTILKYENLMFFNLAEVSCLDLKYALVEVVKGFRTLLIQRMLTDHINDNQTIMKRFKSLQEKADTIPQSTQTLLSLVAYMENARKKDVPLMLDAIAESRERMMYLLDVVLFTEHEVTLNNDVMILPRKFEVLFDQSTLILEANREKLEEALTSRITKITSDLEMMGHRLIELDDYNEFNLMAQYAADVKTLQKRLQDFRELADEINLEEALFKIPPTTFPELDNLFCILDPFSKLFNLIMKWQRAEKMWMDGFLLELDAEAVESACDEMIKDLQKLQRQFKIIQKQHAEEMQKKDKRRKEKIDNLPPSNPMRLAEQAIKYIASFKITIPVIAILCYTGIRQRHWDAMAKILGFDVTPDAGTTLRKALRWGMEPHLEKLDYVRVSAIKEFALEKALYKMIADWEGIEFQFSLYKDSGIPMLKLVEDVQVLLDEQLMKTQVIKSSPNVKPFEVEVKEWDATLQRLATTLDEWQKTQMNWMYLENIFASPDINQQMPEEGKLFSQVDRIWKDTMKGIGTSVAYYAGLHRRKRMRKKMVIETISEQGFMEQWQECNQMLDQILVGLNLYLEKKRIFFPRPLILFSKNLTRRKSYEDTSSPLFELNLKRSYSI